jgi:hypothetical protein
VPKQAVRRHHIKRKNVVGGVALRPAPGHTLATAEAVTDRTHRGAGAVHRRQADLGRLVDHLSPADTGLDPRSSILRVDRHPAHTPSADQHRTLRGTNDLVSGVIHRDWQTALRREPDRGLHIRFACDTDDQSRLENEIGVVAGALGSVHVVTRQDDRPRDLGRELGRLLASDGRTTGFWVTHRLHRLLLCRWRFERLESTTLRSSTWPFRKWGTGWAEYVRPCAFATGLHLQFFRGVSEQSASCEIGRAPSDRGLDPERIERHGSVACEERVLETASAL